MIKTPKSKPSWAALTALLLLGACSTDTWFGEEKDPPLPGERISVLALEQGLAPDPEISGNEILLPRPFQNSSWPQAGGYANHAMHHLAVANNLRSVWKTDAGSGRGDNERLVASPVIADGVLFTMDSHNNVTAFKADSGQALWRTSLTPDEEDSEHFSGGLAVEGGRVFAATGFAEVVALDAKTGKTVWRQKVTAPMHAAPAVRGGRVFVVTIANTLHALGADDGRSLWSYAGTEETASLLGAASPAVDSGIVVAPFSSGELVALKVENGRVLWNDNLARTSRTRAVSALAQIRGRPIIDRGLVIAVSHAGRMAALDLVNGRRVWNKPIGSQESPWVAGDYIFVISNDQELVALSRKTGSVHWVQALPRYEDAEDKTGIINWTGPVLVSNRLIVAGSDGRALAVSPYTGKMLGSDNMPDGLHLPPVVANAMVYFLTEDATVSAYR